MYQCFCKQSFNSKKSLSLHLTKGEKLKGLNKEQQLVFLVYGKRKVNHLIKKYIAELVCSDELKQQGYDLRLYLKLLGIKRTNQQEKLTIRYLAKNEASCINKYGVKNVSQLKEVKDKKINTHIVNYGTENNFVITNIKEKAHANLNELIKDPANRKKQLDKYINTCKERYGTDNVSKHKPTAKKISNSLKNRCANLTLDEKRKMTQAARDYWSSQFSWESKIEIKIHFLLTSINIIFQKHQTIYGYNYDVIIGEHIIEINGDYWHGNPVKYKADDILLGDLKASEVWAKDHRKKEVAIQNGKKYLVLWECDIISSTDNELITLLKSFLDK